MSAGPDMLLEVPAPVGPAPAVRTLERATAVGARRAAGDCYPEATDPRGDRRGPHGRVVPVEHLSHLVGVLLG